MVVPYVGTEGWGFWDRAIPPAVDLINFSGDSEHDDSDDNDDDGIVIASHYSTCCAGMPTLVAGGQLPLLPFPRT